MESGTISNELEVFDLDIVQGFEASLTNNYLSDEFESNFKYPLSCLVFFPRQQVAVYLKLLIDSFSIFFFHRLTNMVRAILS